MFIAYHTSDSWMNACLNVCWFGSLEDGDDDDDVDDGKYVCMHISKTGYDSLTTPEEIG